MGRKILVVDDSAFTRQVLRKALNARGFREVIEATNGEEGLRLYQRERPDLVLLDVVMPSPQGSEVLKRLMVMDENAKVIMLSAVGQEKTMDTCINLGAVGYITKPFDDEQLVHTMKKILRTPKKKTKPLAKLTNTEQNTLRAVSEAAVERTAMALSTMIRQTVNAKLKAAKITSLTDIPELVGNGETMMIGTYLPVTGDISGSLLMVFPPKSAFTLVDMLLKKKVGTTQKLDEMDESALSEVGNVLAGNCLTALSNALGMQLVEHVPDLIHGTIESLIDNITIGLEAEQALTIQVELRTEGKTRIEVYFFLIFALKEAHAVLRAINIYAMEKSTRMLSTAVRTSLDAIVVASPVNGKLLFCNDAFLELWKVKGDYHNLSYADNFDVDESTPLEPLHHGWTGELTAKATDGQTFPVHVTASHVVDKQGKIVGLLSILRDITERKRLQERLLRSKKLATIGEVAAVVSHEIRNPLGVIKNSAYFLNMKLKNLTDEKVKKHLEIIEREVSSANLIISDLLDFAKKTLPTPKQTDLNDIVMSTLSKSFIPKNIKVTTKLGEIPPMFLDQEQIHRVLQNIILNAVQAMPEGGKIKIQTLKQDDSVKITVKDIGIGIPEENLPKLFTPLFSTKAKGVGLGLAISKQIIEGHSGNITVKSKKDRGSTFTIELPIRTEKEVQEGPTVTVDLPVGRRVKSE